MDIRDTAHWLHAEWMHLSITAAMAYLGGLFTNLSRVLGRYRLVKASFLDRKVLAQLRLREGHLLTSEDIATALEVNPEQVAESLDRLRKDGKVKVAGLGTVQNPHPLWIATYN